jgi:hypothetical protein
LKRNQGYRIYLTVTDSAGLTFTTYRDVAPKSAQLTITSNPAGAPLTLDGQSLATAFTQSLVGATRTLSAPLSTTINGVLYTFVSWSDGGAATHDITVPADRHDLHRHLPARRIRPDAVCRRRRRNNPGHD